MFERFTADARRVVVLAQEEARMLNHNYIGTEHLLLATISDRGIAGQALADLGVTRDEAVERVVEILGRGLSPQNGHLAFTPRAKAVLEMALRTALKIGHDYIGSEHLLLGLTSNPKSVSGQALILCGVANRTVTLRVGELMTTRPEPKPEPAFVLAG